MRRLVRSSRLTAAPRPSHTRAFRASPRRLAQHPTQQRDSASPPPRHKPHSHHRRRAQTRSGATTAEFDLGNGITAAVPAASGSPPRPANSPSALAVSLAAPVQETTPATLAAAAHAAQRDLVAHTILLGTARASAGAGANVGAQATLTASDGGSISSTLSPVDLDRLTQHSLPLLLSAAEVFSEEETSSVDSARLSAFTAAQHDLAEYLRWLDGTAARTTGRRYEAALPAALVTQLWQSAMPPLFQAMRRLQRRQEEQQRGQRGSGEEALGQAPNALTPSPLLASTQETRKLTKDFTQSFRDARRALAVRTRAVADLLVVDSPDQLVRTLAQMQFCGALGDDILSPIADRLLARYEDAARDRTGANMQRVAKNHLLTARAIATPLPRAIVGKSLSPSAAITLARLLGRQQAPSHFGLHKLTHTLLLPVIAPELARSAAQLSEAPERKAERDGAAPPSSPPPPRAALEDLTRCFVHYAVSGPAAEHLAALWQPHVLGDEAGEGSGPFTVEACTSLMRILAQPPASAAAGKAPRRPEKLSGPSSARLHDLHAGIGGRSKARRDSLVAADEYVPLVEMLCASMAQTCQRYLAQHGVPADAGSRTQTSAISDPVPATAGAARSCQDMTPEALLRWMLTLLKVNSPQWAEVYTLSATATLVSISITPDQAANHADHAAAPESAGGDRLPVALVEQFIYELLQRHTHIPHHPLHVVLLKRLLHAPETHCSATFASTALLALELMAPPSSTPSLLSQREPREASEAATDASDTPSLGPLANRADALEALAGDASWEIGPQDTAAAFALLRHHGSSLNLTAFVAAMCVSPVGSLPVKSQGRLLNHFTSMASALHPVWLARGIMAATEKLAPEVVGKDGVSVHKWLSRFTAVDVTRKLDLSQCAGLLAVLATREDYLANNAIALHTIVRRIGTLLKAETHPAGALEVVPTLVPALQQAHVFYAPLFARLCRLLLAEVAEAPWDALLPAFAATADEFMRRPRHEGEATVFRDVWELLRQRVMADAAESLAHADVLAALNGFASLDGGDRPLFLTLARRLWVTVEADVAREGEEGRVARLRANVGRDVCRSLTPSAVAALARCLLFKRTGPDVEVMLPWTLLALADPSAPVARDLYPIDVVQLMPSLLTAFTTLSRTARPSQGEGEGPADSLLAGLLHRAYDACREQFLLMYEELCAPVQQEAAHEGTSPSSASTAAAAAAAAGAALARTQREEWSPKVRASVDVVPKRHFAAILVELSGSGLRDAAVATACAAKCCTARCCQELLSIQSLVDLCMALCMQFPPAHHPPHSHPMQPQQEEPVHGSDPRDENDARAEPAEEAGGAKTDAPAGPAASGPAPPQHARFMPPVLNALWRRTDELDAPHIDALLRCLRFFYGSSVDEDFVQRLQDQKGMLAARAEARQPLSQEAAEARPRGEDRSAEVPAEAVLQLAAEDATRSPAATVVDDDLALSMMDSLEDS